jgi:hypothetical protein
MSIVDGMRFIFGNCDGMGLIFGNYDAMVLK